MTNLCVADCLMAVYLALIGGADWVFRGSYAWQDEWWRNSPVCMIAGILSLLSCECSAIMILLITIDRFIVLHFPFTQHRFRRFSAIMTCIAVWFVCAIIVTIPLLSEARMSKFYSKVGLSNIIKTM